MPMVEQVIPEQEISTGLLNLGKYHKYTSKLLRIGVNYASYDKSVEEENTIMLKS